MNFAIQEVVEFSTALIFALSAILAIFLTQNYIQNRMKSYFFWSVGLWLFAAAVSEEILFSLGYYGKLLIVSYLGIVALLVESLALGSVQLVKARRIRSVYYAYGIGSALALAYFLSTENIGNILDNYVVFGIVPSGVVIASSLITFPAAVVLISTAALSYKKTRNQKMLSIVAGVIVVSIAGSLYIAQFPAFLYYSEFIGILLLWFGFFDFSLGRNKDKEMSSIPAKKSLSN